MARSCGRKYEKSWKFNTPQHDTKWNRSRPHWKIIEESECHSLHDEEASNLPGHDSTIAWALGFPNSALFRYVFHNICVNHIRFVSKLTMRRFVVRSPIEAQRNFNKNKHENGKLCWSMWFLSNQTKKRVRNCWYVEVRAVQKYVDLVDLVNSFQTNIKYLLANIGVDTTEIESRTSLRQHGYGDEI